MQVSTRKADCLTCGFWHYRPYLGDFVYGQFIAQGSTGEVFAYLNELENAGWDRIRILADEICSDTPFFHWLLGQCLDPVSGASLSICSGVRCPRCGSSDMKLHDTFASEPVEIPEATFTVFLSLDPHEQRTHVVELHRVWRTQRSTP